MVTKEGVLTSGPGEGVSGVGGKFRVKVSGFVSCQIALRLTGF